MSDLPGVPCRQCGWPYDVGQDGLCPNCRGLARNPDPLSKRKELGGVPFEDMKQLDEADRFQLIARHIRENPGRNILVMVDTGEGYADKGDRYIKAIRELVPGVKVVSRGPGPVPQAESITFKL